MRCQTAACERERGAGLLPADICCDTAVCSHAMHVADKASVAGSRKSAGTCLISSSSQVDAVTCCCADA
eukprot:3067892-Rhodomonas_salina.1